MLSWIPILGGLNHLTWYYTVIERTLFKNNFFKINSNILLWKIKRFTENSIFYRFLQFRKNVRKIVSKQSICIPFLFRLILTKVVIIMVIMSVSWVINSSKAPINFGKGNKAQALWLQPRFFPSFRPSFEAIKMVNRG